MLLAQPEQTWPPPACRCRPSQNRCSQRWVLAQPRLEEAGSAWERSAQPSRGWQWADRTGTRPAWPGLLVPAHARICLTRPSREGKDPAQPGMKCAGPARILPAPAQAGFSPRQPRRDAAAPKLQPSRGPRRPEPTGKGLTRPRTSLFRPKKAKIAICRPGGVNSGQKKIYAGREVPESTPGPHMLTGT
jgi:hypothetical protein